MNKIFKTFQNFFVSSKPKIISLYANYAKNKEKNPQIKNQQSFSSITETETKMERVEEKEQGNEKNKGYRLFARKYYFTYSTYSIVDERVDCEQILEALRDQVFSDPFDYVIAQEYHEDGSKHFHALIIAGKKLCL